MSLNNRRGTREVGFKSPGKKVSKANAVRDARPLTALKAGILFALLFFLAVAGCEQYEDPNAIESREYDQRTPLFSTFRNLNNSMIKWLNTAAQLQNSSSIRYPFCIYTEDIARDVNVENQVKEWSTIAMNTWLKPLVGQPQWRVTRAEAYRVERQGSSCPITHNGLRVYHIRINNMQGGNNHVSDLRMNMGNWGVHKLVVLHEMGHACGLADTYSWEGREPIGQPSATMNNVWSLNGVLQQDDIDAIRFVWARLRGATDDICPDGYKISQIKIKGEVVDKGTWGESFCLPDEGGGGGDECVDKNTNCSGWAANGECTKNPNYMIPNCCKSCKNNDKCPNDSQKTEPGACGCGVADTDSDKDGTPDCNDKCPGDPQKTAPGQCGCNKAEGTCNGGDCVDNYPSCPQWASAGYCQEKYVSFMEKNCCASCKGGGGDDDSLASTDFIGYYERTPVANDWHKVNISLENNTLWWKNVAGVKWTLKFSNEILKTDASCPYGEKTISVITQGDSNTITGLRFNGEIYYKR